MKNIKKCNGINKSYTPFLCIFLTLFAFSCASVSAYQIPKDERMNSGINIAASMPGAVDPWEVDRSIISVVKVKVINDVDYKIQTDVVCERNNGDKKTITVTVDAYTVRELYFGFHRSKFYKSFTCQLDNVEKLEWFPPE